MKTIFIPVDFTDQSLLSCNFALHAFKGQDLEITFFHSYFDQLALAESHLTTDLEPNMIGLMDERVFNDLKEAAEENLSNLEKEAHALLKAMNLQNVDIKVKAEGGLPLNEVLHNIKENHYDLIILGSKKDPKQRLGESSLQAKIMNKSNVPVVVVPPEYEGGDIQNMIYLTEFKMIDIENIDLLAKLFHNTNSTIEILHFVEGKSDPAEKNMENLREAFASKDVLPRLKFNVRSSENIIESLHQSIMENQVSIIAFMPHKRGLTHLFSHQILNKKKLLHLELPIIAIPLDKEKQNN